MTLQGKIIRQSEKFPKTSGLQCVTWGGAVFMLKDKRQFRLS